VEGKTDRMLKSSPAIGLVNVELQTNVSEIFSVSIIRIDDPEDSSTFIYHESFKSYKTERGL
jgi:hypothetical protein